MKTPARDPMITLPPFAMGHRSRGASLTPPSGLAPASETSPSGDDAAAGERAKADASLALLGERRGEEAGQ